MDQLRKLFDDFKVLAQPGRPKWPLFAAAAAVTLAVTVGASTFFRRSRQTRSRSQSSRNNMLTDTRAVIVCGPAGVGSCKLVNCKPLALMEVSRTP